MSHSLHKSGARYKWRINPVTDGLDDLADFPADALKYFSKLCVKTKKLDPAELHSKGIPDGCKHQDGYRYACRLRHLGLCFDEAVVLLENVFSKCDPPPRDGVKKAAYDRVMAAWGKYSPGTKSGDPQYEPTTIKFRPSFH